MGTGADKGMSPFASPVRRGQWRPDRWGTMVCRAVWDETHDVRSFLLAPADGARINHEPGQYITVRTAGESGTERSYTITSSAASDRAVAITVKKKPGGVLSGHLHDTLKPGDTIEAFGPAGRFGPVAAPAERYLLLSAGSGVTPMLATVRTAADLGIDLDAVFLHAARTEEDLIGLAELTALARRLPRLRIVMVPSRPVNGWAGAKGRLDAAALAGHVPDCASRTVLCCGPESFMATMREALAELGLPPTAYFEESFDFGAIGNDLVADDTLPARRITFARSGKSFDCPQGTTILAAAKAAGIAMPSSCAKGECGTCKSFKVSGTVTMGATTALRQREIDRGFILPCSSRPETDVVLDR
ncbi:hybrid-cluster NAD(P)-dependent oxidoreductase [Acuticoccus sp. M5D2P5]|uniref:hybrid-cluster NAD(P)-dependent oxidoreductase n=1 Tax=Acuticoccus kalidii TaxID=2910977 RepID=UPI001F19F56A|nr:hybrid-cluster NAD(P)-dependent oxidoreductase [Acuticoccus kalidii]MCF3932345.1 hybrid-cluster NAD(P)-dependent oxidoreductase [Acuticoccus kalidii]